MADPMVARSAVNSAGKMDRWRDNRLAKMLAAWWVGIMVLRKARQMEY